jgi:hypothetical protein
MYSPNVVQKTLDDFAVREGWEPRPHSLGQVEEFSEYINKIIRIEKTQTSRYIDFKPDVRLTEKEKKAIRRFIRNEQFLCFASSNYWETRYAWIGDEAGNIFKFSNRKSQDVFDRVLEPFDELQVAIELFCMKSRQVGITTKAALKFLHRLLFIPHTQSVMASVKARTSALVARILDVCWQRQPFWLVPGQISAKASTPQWANGSILSIQSGSQGVGIAQGWTPQLVHITELADIPNPKKTLEEGLFPAVHSTRKTFFVMEGTGDDSTSWQADKWRYYKANWGKGGRFMPMFIPWPCATDLYPEPDWLKNHPVPYPWEPIPETRRMKAEAELYIRSTDYLARIMGVRWEMPKEQAWMWETKYREALASHTLRTLYTQYPVSDMQALQSKNDLVFSSDTILEINSRREKIYQAYAVTGQSVLIGQDDKPYEPPAEEIDYDKERIRVSWKTKGGQMLYWELVPLKEFADTEDFPAFNKLLVFRPPEEKCDYSIGIDTADGLGNPDEDRSVASVMLNRQGNHRDEETAQFVSNNVNAPQMTSIAACLASWYGQWSESRSGTRDPRGVKFIIEQRERYGDDCQFQLKLMGFFYHHQFQQYDHKDVHGTESKILGWRSNFWSRPMLVTRFMDAVTNGWIKVNSPMSVRQLSTWVRKTSKTGRTKLEHESGFHDDNLMSLAMAYFTRHSHEADAMRHQAKYRSAEDDTPPLNLEWAENRITI